MHTIKYLHLKPEQQVTDIAWVTNESRVTKIPLAIQVKGLSFFQVHNRVFWFQPYAEWSSRRCQVFVP